MLRCLWLAWGALTWISAMLSSAGCLLPYWTKGLIRVSIANNQIEYPSNIGLFRRCVYPIYGKEGSVQIVEECGHYLFVSIPHIYWQVSLIVLAVSCIIHVYLTFIIFFLGFCLDILRQPVVFRACQIAQLFSSFLIIAACLLYVLGWQDNPEVHQLCGEQAAIFSPGRCQIGWAFVLTGAGGLLSLVAMILPCLISPINPVRFPISKPQHSGLNSPCGQSGIGFTPVRPSISMSQRLPYGSIHQLQQQQQQQQRQPYLLSSNNRRESWAVGLGPASSYQSLFNGSQLNIMSARPSSAVFNDRRWSNVHAYSVQRLDEAPGSDRDSIFDEGADLMGPT